ncbi:MAG: ATP-binding cassette domain-containing protein [Gemmatimonadales bacterium]
MAVTPVLQADSIHKVFGPRTVLTAATLRAVPGQLTYLVGRNGCGKSTLLRIAAGELQAEGGVVFYKGRAMLRPRWHRLARTGFAYLPDRELLAPRRTLREHLDVVVRQFGLPEPSDAVRRCGVERLLDVPCASLSTGERRRAELATILARRPDCLLADEPHRHIDPEDRAVISEALRDLARTGCAVVVTGHELEDLIRAADAVTWCTDGTTYELGSAKEALGHWRLVREYMGARRATELLEELEAIR